MTRPFFYFVLCVCALFCCIGPSDAQQHWTRFDPQGTNQDAYHTVYFINPQIGFRFYAGIASMGSTILPYISREYTKIERTTDSGVTWTKLPIIGSGMFGNASLSQLCFVSVGHGYAATTVDHPGIYETWDTGSHWRRISPEQNFSGVYCARGKIFASTAARIDNSSALGSILFTSDDGKTWDSLTAIPNLDTTGKTEGFEFIDGNREDLVATVAYVIDSSVRPLVTVRKYSTFLVFSTDLGRTWQTVPMDTGYYWGTTTLHIAPHSCRILRQFVGIPTQSDDTFDLLAALPPKYDRWDTVMSHEETGAWAVGTRCATYISYANDINPKQITFIRSTDDGASFQQEVTTETKWPWAYEIDDADFCNLSVVGYGAVLYCYTGYTSRNPNSGYLFRTTDGGDGTLSIASLAPTLSFTHTIGSSTNDTLVTGCNGGVVTAIDQNLRCAITQFQTVSVNGLDSNEYSLLRTHHDGCQDLPDTTVIAIKPTHDTTRTLTVHAQYMDDEFVKTDTTFAFTLVSKVIAGNDYVLGIGLRSGTITATAGDTISIPVTLTILSGPKTLQLTKTALQEFDASMNTNLLTPLDFVSSVAEASGFVHDISQTSCGFSLLLSNGLTATGVTVLGSLRCIVRVADTEQTQVTLSKGSITSADTACLEESVPEDGSNVFVTLLPLCGVSTLEQFMKGQLPEAITGLYPNPASEELTVNFRNDLKRPISYQLIDALGISHLSRSTTTNTDVVDVSQIRPGIYYLVAQSPGGIRATREVVIDR
jgi:hypothetical protein